MEDSNNNWEARLDEVPVTHFSLPVDGFKNALQGKASVDILLVASMVHKSGIHQLMLVASPMIHRVLGCHLKGGWVPLGFLNLPSTSTVGF